MKILNRIIYSFAVLSLCLDACVSKPIGQFSTQDFIVARPFNKRDTVVYFSKIGKADTIVFFPVQVDTIKRRSFEQGFYDAYVMGIEYELTHGSYHVIKNVNDNKVLYSTIPELFYSVNISTKEYSGKTLSFLGLIFRENELEKMPIDSNSIISFKWDETKNNSRGINSFTFSPQVGVVSYVDTSGEEWIRRWW